MRAIIRKNQSGFTLIETLVYLALFGIIIGGVLACAYYIIEASKHAQERAILEEEALFLSAKINHALTGATAVATPNGTTLNITNPSGNTSFTFVGSELRLDSTALNSSSVDVKALSFVYTPASGSLPASVESHFSVESVVNGRTHEVDSTKYLRQ